MGAGTKKAKPGKAGKGMKMMSVPVMVLDNKKQIGMAAVLTLIGVPSLIVLSTNNNDSEQIFERSCPAVEGRVYKWGFRYSVFLTVVAFICLCRSGLVSRCPVNGSHFLVKLKIFPSWQISMQFAF